MRAKELMGKAKRAAVSARVLLDNGDTDGACNRAYYAMYDAARAALLFYDSEFELGSIRTHSGLISHFSMQLVKSGRVSMELGKSLNKAEELRLIADYKGDSIEEEDTVWVVDQAQLFVETMQELMN